MREFYYSVRDFKVKEVRDEDIILIIFMSGGNFIVFAIAICNSIIAQ